MAKTTPIESGTEETEEIELEDLFPVDEDEEKDEEDDAEDDDDTPDDDEESEDDSEEDDAEDDEAEEDDEELSEEAIAKLVKRYKDDPKELAKALLHAKKQIGKQGDELGKHRKADPPKDTSATTPRNDEVQLGYDPNGEHDEDTGWPLDGEGDPYQPVDAFGVPFTPEPRLRVIAEEYAEKYGAVFGATKFAQYQQAEEQKRQQAYAQKYTKEVRPQQEESLTQVETRIAKRFGKEYPENVAKGLAKHYREQAIALVDAHISQGKLTWGQVYHPEALKRAFDLVIEHAEDNDLIALEAERLGRTGKGKKSPAKAAAPTGARRSNPSAAASPTGGRSGSQSRSRNADTSSKDFVFED